MRVARMPSDTLAPGSAGGSMVWQARPVETHRWHMSDSFRAGDHPGEPVDYLVLSSYPEYGSRNVGDKLILESFLRLLQQIKPYRSTSVQWRGDPIRAEDFKAIVMPGMAIRHRTWPDCYRMTDRLDSVAAPLIGVGVGSKRQETHIEDVRRYRLDAGSRQLLERVFADSGTVACRDVATAFELSAAGLPTTLVGDCGMFNPDLIGSTPNRTDRLSSVAFTPPRRTELGRQALQVIGALQSTWPSTELVLFRHGIPNKTERWVERQSGLRVIDVSGNVEALRRYRNIDVHIGYRVHAHLWRMRNRQPSVLIEEDSRGVGFNRTLGQIGVPSRMSVSRPVEMLRRIRHRSGGVSVSVPEAVQDVLAAGLASGWECLDTAAATIDWLYRHRMVPFIETMP